VKIAVDFDGTIVEHEYPRIGKDKIFNFETLKLLKENGHQLILWTFRSGKTLDDAVEYCKKNGVEFFSVNSNFKGEKYDGSFSRKVNADIFIDDRNLGGFPGWNIVWEILKPESKYDPLNENIFWTPWETSSQIKKKRKKILGIF